MYHSKKKKLLQYTKFWQLHVAQQNILNSVTAASEFKYRKSLVSTVTSTKNKFKEFLSNAKKKV